MLLQPKRLHAGTNSLTFFTPNFARACGRVSIGGHPDKRPDSRLRKHRLPCSRDPPSPTGFGGSGSPPKHLATAGSCDRQPEAKPAHPALHGGRGLKQRRNGLFWIL